MNLYCRNQLCVKVNGVEHQLQEIQSQEGNISSEYSWIGTLYCLSCKCTFYKCNECIVKKITNKPMLKQDLWRHQKKFHNDVLHNNKVTEDRKRTNIKAYELTYISV